MIDFIGTRPGIGAAAKVLQWDQGGRSGVITDTNCVYALTPAVDVKVRHLSTATKIRLTRTRQVPGKWDDGNFDDKDELIWTNRLSGGDLSIVISFLDSQTQAPIGVRAAGANIQSWTLGEFTGVITAVDLRGVMKPQPVLCESNAVAGSANFLGMGSSNGADIQRIEFRTTDIVEEGHSDFDPMGFAINKLSVLL